MNPQLALDLSPPRARRHDVETSHAAAARSESFVAGHEAKILAVLRDQAPVNATYRVIANLAGLECVAVARRLKAMERRGLVETTGDTMDGCRTWRWVRP